jgi:hypothetical protein
MANNAGKTVAEILKTKRGNIKTVPLEENSPSWAEILHLTWEEIEERADRNEPGFRTFKKLLERKRFDK